MTDEVLAALRSYRLAHPELRLGQIIVNAISEVRAVHAPVVFYATDDQILEGLARLSADDHGGAQPTLDELAVTFRAASTIEALLELAQQLHWSDEGIVHWLYGPTTYLDGKRPIDLLTSDPDLVLRAARDDWGIEW